MSALTPWNTSGAAPSGAIAADLHKALTVGYPNLPGSSGGSALVPQVLDDLLVNLSFGMPDVKLWNMLPKITNKSTVAQYAELSSYGNAGYDRAFIAEIDVPGISSAQYNTRFDTLKQIAFQGGVSFTAQEVGGIVEPLAQESKTVVMNMLRAIELSLWYGNSAISPTQWDGFIPRILARSPSENIFDLRGQPLRQDILDRAAVTVQTEPKFGKLTHLFLNTACKGDIAISLIPTQRSLLGNVDNGNTYLGIDPRGFRTVGGNVDFVDTPFLTDGGSPSPSIDGLAAMVPATPTVSAATVAAPTGGQPASRFSTAQDVGTVYYTVQAGNRYGRSAPVNVAGPVTTVQDQLVSFEITPGAGTLPEYYAVFRTRVNSTSIGLQDRRLILKVPNIDNNEQPIAAPSTVIDSNAKLPGTYDAVGFDMNPEYVRFVQTGPMTRIPLAITDTSFKFMVRLVGSPQLRAPGRVVLFQNVGLAPVPTPAV